jgi:hypothetical protein
MGSEAGVLVVPDLHALAPTSEYPTVPTYNLSQPFPTGDPPLAFQTTMAAFNAAHALLHGV